MIMRILLFLFSMISASSFATSCAESIEEYYGVCKSSSCTLFLTVGQVKSFGVCGRRSKIVQPSEDVKGFIESVFDNRSQSVQRLTIPYSYYGHDSPATLQQVKESLGMSLVGVSESSGEVTPDVLRAYAIGKEESWEIRLETVSVDVSDNRLDEIKNSKNNLEFRQYVKDVASYAVLAITWAVLLAVSVFSINRFYRVFFCKKRIDKVAISIQLFLGVVMILAANILPEPFWIVVVLVPGLVLAFVSELFLAFVSKIKSTL